jgi:predicted nucleic acid-binding protein
LLDACAVVNLFATGAIEEIAHAVGGRVAIAESVFNEAQYVFVGGNGPDRRDRQKIDLSPLLASRSIEVLVSSSDDELTTFIDLTRVLDDGEAMTGALAIHRGLSVVTDDRKAIRVLTEQGVICHSTLKLVHNWSEKHRIEAFELRAALIQMQDKARYAPGRSHPLRAWWESAVATEQTR